MSADVLQYLDLALLSERVNTFIPRLASAAFLAVIFWLAIKILSRLLSAELCREGIPKSASNLLVRFIRYGLTIIAVLTILGQLGVNVTSLVAGLGIAGLAVSFAAQDTVANLISGITLAVDRPFKEGDWITLSGTHASVTEMRLRTTVLTTFDNETMVVPNKALAQERIVNYTMTPRIRVRVGVRIAFKEDIGRARAILLGLLADDERILPEPAPLVIVSQIGTSSIDLEMRFWTEDSWLKFALYWEFTEAAKKALDAAGVQIPYPHMQVLFDDSAGSAQLPASPQIPNG